ncbi:MAG: isopentenyl-diphosphate Delta-isomerase [Pseudonocardia sp.]
MTEYVVLVDDSGRPIGSADKATVHAAITPRHLGFSCYGFDARGQLLVTRRARAKRTFPSMWTNTCCGHPAPGERLEDAVRRRVDHELGMQATEVRLVLPDFSYRASDGGVEENELCPVLVCRLEGRPRPRPDEVEDWSWWRWKRFLRIAAGPEVLTPWARLQAPLLAARQEWQTAMGCCAPERVTLPTRGPTRR